MFYLQDRLTFNMFSDEGVIHYVTVICLQNFLKLCDVIVLIGTEIRKYTKQYIMKCISTTIVFQDELSLLKIIILIILVICNTM